MLLLARPQALGLVLLLLAGGVLLVEPGHQVLLLLEELPLQVEHLVLLLEQLGLLLLEQLGLVVLVLLG